MMMMTRLMMRRGRMKAQGEIVTWDSGPEDTGGTPGLRKIEGILHITKSSSMILFLAIFVFFELSSKYRIKTPHVKLAVCEFPVERREYRDTRAEDAVPTEAHTGGQALRVPKGEVKPEHEPES